MSIEKQVNPGAFQDDEKKKKEAHERKIAETISKRFNISENAGRELVKLSTLGGLDDLKSKIGQLEADNVDNLGLDKVDTEKLFFMLKGAKELIESESRNEILSLKEEFDYLTEIGNVTLLKKLFPEELIRVAENPKNIHENIIGFSLGTLNSIIKFADFLYLVGKGVVSTPYHIGLILAGKGNYKNWKRI